MATNIENTTVGANSFVTPSSRYIDSTVVLYGDDKIITFATYKRKSFPLVSTDKYAVVPPGEEYRPDLTSYRAYGSVDYWWQILEANNLKDIFDYKSGINIRIPSPFNILD